MEDFRFNNKLRFFKKKKKKIIFGRAPLSNKALRWGTKIWITAVKREYHGWHQLYKLEGNETNPMKVTGGWWDRTVNSITNKPNHCKFVIIVTYWIQ